MKTSAKIALVHPLNIQRSWSKSWPVKFADTVPPEITQLDVAENYIYEAAKEGAGYLLFPEMYPGPHYLSDNAYTPDDVRARMCAAAAKANIWVFYNGAIPAPGGGQSNACIAVSPEGKVIDTYTKMIPACNEKNVPGDRPVVVDCDGLKIGIIICWEAWFPEIIRMTAGMGADVVFCPTGGLVYELTPTWKTIVAARAAENVVFTAACVNLFGVEDGMCAVYSPEGLVAERAGVGILYATLDLERLRYLRDTDEALVVPKPYRTIPGLWRALKPSVIERCAEESVKLAKG